MKFKKIFINCLAILISFTMSGQVPTYFNSNSALGANTIPFNNFLGNRQASWFIGAGTLGTLPPSLFVTHVYLHFASTTTLICPNFEIKLKTSTGVSLTGLIGGPVESGFTTVLSATNYTLSTTGGQWKQFVLQTPFLWNNTSLPIIVQFQHNATTGTGANLYQANTVSSGNGRQWSDFNGTLNDGVGSQIVNFGIDVNPFFISSSITCSALGSATANIPGGTGPYSYTWMPSAQNSSVATGLLPGSYTLSIYDIGNNATYTVPAIFTSSVPIAGTIQNTGSLACNGVNNGTANIALNGGSGNYSYLWTNGSASYTSPTIASLGPSNYTVTVIDALTACQTTNTFQIVQPSPRTVSLSASSVSACVGSSITLTAIAGGGLPAYTYSWTGGPTSSTNSVSQGNGGLFTYSVTSFDANNCSIPDTIVVAFVNLPILTAQNVSVCPGNTGTLTVTGANSYTWLPGGVSGSSYTNNPSSTSVYSVIGTASACTNQGTVAIVVKPTPLLSFSTFSITCASLGSATVFPTGGTGPFSYSWMPGSLTGSSVSGLNPNSYTITVFDIGTSCTSTGNTQFTSLIPLSGTLNNTSALICNSVNTATANFTNIAGGSAIQNYLWTNGINSLSTPSVGGLSAGVWTVVVTDALTGCQINQSFLITQPPPLILNLSPNTPTSCVNTNIVLTGTNSGGTPFTVGPSYNYTWTNGAAINTRTVNETSGATYIYTLNSSDSNNCLTSNTISVDFINTPVLSISNISVCPLAFGTLLVSGASGYLWNNNSVGNSLTDSPVISQQYTVIGSALGCTAAATASIILHPSPIPVINNNSPVCNGQALQLSASGGIGYLWTGPLGFGSSLQVSAVNNASPLNSGAYNLTVTSVEGCTASTSSNLTVNPTPTLSATGATVCTSQTLNLTAGSFVGSSFVWSGPDNFSSILQNPSIVNPGLNSTGVYTVIATSAVGCTNIAIASASVTSPPSLMVSLSSPSMCYQAFNGSPNTIVLTSTGASGYTLYTPSLIGATSPSGPTSSLTSLPPYSTTATVGTATLIGTNGVCSSSRTVVFTLVPNPTVGINSYTPVICAGKNFTYTAFGANSYTWGPNSPNLTTYTSDSTVANPGVTSMFSVVGGSMGCYSPTQTSTITVVPLPTITVTPVSPKICLNQKITLTANGTGSSFTWSPNAGLSDISGQSVVASPLSTQNFTVIASANNCTNTANITVTVYKLPQPAITISNPTVCLYDRVTLQGSGGLSCDWYGPSGFFLNGENISFSPGSMQNAGLYTLTVTDLNGCKNSTATYLSINDLPKGRLNGYKKEGCVPFCNNYDFVSSGSTISNWTINNQVINKNKFSYCFDESRTYTIKGDLYDSLTSCRNKISYDVIAYPKPEAHFYYLPLKPVENLDEVIFTNSSLGEEQLKWNWFFRDNKGFTSQSKNFSYLFSNEGLYPVVMIVSNKWNCADTIIKVIKIEPDFNIYVPNAFTPNGDERNDFFLPILRSVKIYDMKIYNRWGELIFRTTDPRQGWDGFYNSEECKTDVYQYLITLSTSNGQRKEFSGNITLIR